MLLIDVLNRKTTNAAKNHKNETVELRLFIVFEMRLFIPFAYFYYTNKIILKGNWSLKFPFYTWKY